jgi:hypothetical protein
MNVAHVFAVALCALATSVSAQTSSRSSATSSRSAEAQPQIVGMWRLLRTEQRLADGTTRPDPDLGAKPVGYMIYGPSGRMCTVFDNTERPRWSSARPDETELRAMYENMLTYCARYRVDEARGYIVFNLEFGQSPGAAGTTRERRFELVGDHLKLYPTPLPAGVVAWTIELERVQP